MPAPSSPFAPLRQPWFRWLWPAVLVTYLGVWMQTVGVQWALVNLPGAGASVALVQTAAMLPIMLFALPAGVLADVFDRRWLMFSVQVYVFVVAGTLAVLAALDLATPALLLIFTFALGVGGAVLQPTWQSVIPELVPREEVAAATRLEMVSINVGRSIGPALAGVVIAVSGVWTVFALNAFSVVLLAVVLLLWRRTPPPGPRPTRERFVPALRAGTRYVRHEPLMRRILFRAILFIAPGAALWALLPLAARDRLGVDAGGYGALFAALGLGAIVAALVVGRVRDHVSTNALLTVAGVLFAGTMVVLVLVPVLWLALIVCIFGGLAWTTVISTLNAELQLFLPGWVRARGLAVYLVTFTGALAIASVVWGQTADLVGVSWTFLIAAAVMLAGVVIGFVMTVPETGHIDNETAIYWPDARLATEPDPDVGPVLIILTYTVTPERQAPFLAAMQDMRRSRRRSGATRWELYHDAEHPERFTEIFQVASWEEHLRQHQGRLTRTDQQIEETALSFSDPPAVAHHLLPPQART
ncbi:MAG TPA: MFS transporter [Microlunatus sp.]|nr:MFS transporter [Microlunatus sp.]